MPTIVSGWCASFIEELVTGIHDLVNDDIRLALYTDARDLDSLTLQAYDSEDELVVDGYVAGGAAISVTPKRMSPVAGLLLTDMQWARLTANPRSGLIYNATVENKAIAVLDFFDYQIVDGEFKLIASDNPPYAGFVERIV